MPPCRRHRRERRRFTDTRQRPGEQGRSDGFSEQRQVHCVGRKIPERPVLARVADQHRAGAEQVVDIFAAGDVPDAAGAPSTRRGGEVRSPLYTAMHTGDEMRKGLILLAALPTATSSYILARQLGGDAPLMAAIISGQTLLGMISLPLLLGMLWQAT